MGGKADDNGVSTPISVAAVLSLVTNALRHAAGVLMLNVYGEGVTSFDGKS